MTSPVDHSLPASQPTLFEQSRPQRRGARPPEPDAALPGSARHVVLHAVACEDLDVAGVHPDGEVYRELALGLAEDASESLVEAETVGGGL